MKRKNLILSWLLIISFICGLGGGILAEQSLEEITAYLSNSITINVNGTEFKAFDDDGTEYKPVLYNERTYLPIRALGDALGAEIGWDAQTETVYITNNSACTVNFDDKEIKNVIYLIGDGMGLYHAQLSQWYHVGATDKINMQKMPVTGIISTYSANNGVTDSAAAGTALATGFKTKNKVIGLDENGNKIKNLLEASKELGKSTGLVATSTITDATPAAFSAHQPTRDNHLQIADEISKCNAEVILGGGKQYFLPNSSGGNRTDSRNLLSEMQNNGYAVVNNKNEMNSANSNKIVGLFKNKDLDTPYPSDASGIEPTIEEMTKKAIEVLNKNSNGFVLMVEGSKIDKVAHNNNTDNLINETIHFDNAVKSALDFAQKDGSTLVIVTADHETGGLAMPSAANRTKGNEGTKSTAKWTTKDHSAGNVIVYAYGPGSYSFTGCYDNTDICKKLAALLKLNDFPKVLN